MDSEWHDKNAEEALTGEHVFVAQWWLTYGKKKHPTLTKIAIKVLSMRTTTSPCERNWSTFDPVHTKRRNLLSPNNLQILAFIHWNKKVLHMSRVKMGFVNTERIVWETPKDEAPFDGFMRDGEYDPADVKIRAANCSKSRGCRSTGTRFSVRELQEERVDDGVWILDLPYVPRCVVDDGRGRSIVVDNNDKEESHDNEGGDELLKVQLTDIQSIKRSGGNSCSARHDDITSSAVLASGGPSGAPSVSLSGEAGVRTQERSSTPGGVASVQGTNTLWGAQLTPHWRAMLEEIPTGRGTTNGGSTDVHGDNVEVEVDAGFGGTTGHADGDMGADMDEPTLGTAEDTEVAGNDVFSTLDPGLGLGEGFASLLHHVAPIAPSGSNKDFCEHLSTMSPVQIDFEEQAPDWAKFTRLTSPGRQLSEHIPTEAGKG
ncbi:hypothetical protein CBR_g53709 [Chara braunii]|uniref:HAT C-terminal dimerisation domain-containing protein n=1 Tax=Chara braunii TaxID=69332 RepID=A0A388MB78_CHABU|nr:hypothetical protein CBR_g53709 [Chara braunii]|eukprot:GBG91818.1 hypothetical protein CBR_g53709 [Chara braunii]